jgi:hypothetical protein
MAGPRGLSKTPMTSPLPQLPSPFERPKISPYFILLSNLQRLKNPSFVFLFIFLSISKFNIILQNFKSKIYPPNFNLKILL